MNKDRIDLLNRSADEGDVHEEAVRAKLIREGWKLVSSQDVVEVPIIKGVIVRGHTDGVMIPPVDETDYRPLEHLLEVKSMSNKRFARWQKEKFDGFIKYAYQISVYMMANPGRDVVYIIKRREDGLEERFVIPADNPPIPFKEVRKRVLAVEGHRRKRGSFPECDLTKQEKFWCPFFYLHDEEDPSDELTEMSDEDLAVLADIIPKRMELKRIEDEGKKAEVERKEMDKEIVNLLGGTKQVPELDTRVGTAKITRVDGGNSYLDVDKLRQELGEDLDSFYKRSQYSYPKITFVKKKPKSPLG